MQSLGGRSKVLLGIFDEFTDMQMKVHSPFRKETIDQN